MPILKKLFGKKKDFSNEILLEWMDKFWKNPEIKKHIENSVKRLGKDPIPKIIEPVVLNPYNLETAVLSGLGLIYIGTPSIPYLTELLKHPTVAIFAATTLRYMMQQEIEKKISL